MMSRRASLVALWLYAIAMAGDFAFHLDADRRQGQPWLTPAAFAVAFSASLFWPVDLIVQLLLAR
jgi:hypothetical protein